MIPFRDENPSRSFPTITIIVIALNVIVWFYEVTLQSISDRALGVFIIDTALVPYDLVYRMDLESISNIFTSMFMHGDWLHIGGNMLYLWIFGDNIEDTLGKPLYVFFYFACGIAASLAHVVTAPGSHVPTLGASGAIAGVLGAYLVLFPQARVQTLIILGRWISIRTISALWVLGFWFVLQLIQGFFSLGGSDIAGVAYWAHIGGFVAGAGLRACMRLYAASRCLRASTARPDGFRSAVHCQRRRRDLPRGSHPADRARPGGRSRGGDAESGGREGRTIAAGDACAGSHLAPRNPRRGGRRDRSIEYLLSVSFTADDGTACINVVFLCQYADGEPRIADLGEVAEIRWMTAREVEEDPAAPPWTRENIVVAEERRLSIAASRPL